MCGCAVARYRLNRLPVPQISELSQLRVSAQEGPENPLGCVDKEETWFAEGEVWLLDTLLCSVSQNKGVDSFQRDTFG